MKMDNPWAEWSHKFWKVVMTPSDTEVDDESWTHFVKRHGSLCLCSKSFYMCPRREWFPEDSDFWSGSCSPVLSHWVNVKVGGCRLQCHPLLGCFQDKGRGYEVCMETAPSAVLCPRCTLQLPLTPSGLRQTLALELPSRHFLLLENRHQKRRLTHTDLSTHPFETGWVTTPLFPVFSPAPSQTLVRQQVHQSSPTSGLSFRVVRSSVSSFKNESHTRTVQSSCWWFKDIL